MDFIQTKSLALSLSLAVATLANADAPGSYQAGIWVDPDGCQHWVMDLGVEGMMSPVLQNNGKPVCSKRESCAQLNSDVLFRIDSANLSKEGRSAASKIATQLLSIGNDTVKIVGHTDSTASNGYNKRLSVRRAQAVAAVFKSKGVNVSAAIGAGEAEPRATNATRAGRQANRRVEIICR